MEIYKLGDEAPEGERRTRGREGLTKKHKCDRMGAEALASARVFDGGGEAGNRGEGKNGSGSGGGGAGGERKITGMKPGVKNPNRVNVYVNGEYALSLTVEQVVDLHVKVGEVVSEERVAELAKASEVGKLYQRALEWVLARRRSEREVRDYLVGKLKKSSSDALAPARRAELVRVPRGGRYGGRCAHSLLVSRPDVVRSSSLTSEKTSFLTPFASSSGRERSLEDLFELVQQITSRLASKGYIDDRKFAEWWVENRMVKKGVSAKRLRMELAQKGVAKEIVEEVMAESERSDEEEIRKIIAKKRAKYNDEKLIGYLCRQGFEYGLVRELVTSSEGG